MSQFRFEHKTLSGGRYHVMTSPDIKGFHVTGETEDEAMREAWALLNLLSEKKLIPKVGALKSIDFEEA